MYVYIYIYMSSEDGTARLRWAPGRHCHVAGRIGHAWGLGVSER